MRNREHNYRYVQSLESSDNAQGISIGKRHRHRHTERDGGSARKGCRVRWRRAAACRRRAARRPTRAAPQPACSSTRFASVCKGTRVQAHSQPPPPRVGRGGGKTLRRAAATMESASSTERCSTRTTRAPRSTLETRR